MMRLLNIYKSSLYSLKSPNKVKKIDLILGLVDFLTSKSWNKHVKPSVRRT